MYVLQVYKDTAEIIQNCQYTSCDIQEGHHQAGGNKEKDKRSGVIFYSYIRR